MVGRNEKTQKEGKMTEQKCKSEEMRIWRRNGRQQGRSVKVKK